MWPQGPCAPQSCSASSGRSPGGAVMADVPQMTYARIIEALGGYEAVADELGLNRSAVFRWIQRGIPPHRFAQVEEIARQKGLAWVTLELLHRMRRKGAAPEVALLPNVGPGVLAKVGPPAVPQPRVFRA